MSLVCIALALAAVAMTVGCAGQVSAVAPYKLYPGPVRPVTELAVVLLKEPQRVAFDGRPTAALDYKEVHLLPGLHWIEWPKWNEYIIPKRRGWVTSGRMMDVLLEAGHTYVLQEIRDFPRYLSIKDTTTGEIVAWEYIW